jgi:hypothetical protein
MDDVLIRRGRCCCHRDSIARSVDKIDNDIELGNWKASFNCVSEGNRIQSYGVVLV